MRFDQEKTQTSVREGFDINNANDLRIILEFEREMKGYEGKTFTIEEKTVFGFEKFLHDRGIFRFSRQYPDGIVVDPEGYRIAWKKRRALDALRYKSSISRIGSTNIKMSTNIEWSHLQDSPYSTT